MTNSAKQGIFVISLDFELVWGIFDYIRIKDKAIYFDNTLNIIPRMLDLFVGREIHVTWATVGMLFNRNWEEWEHNSPELKPSYNNKLLDPYLYGRAHQKSGYDRFFFAPDLIRSIQQAPGQEIGTHTYSHYYCLEAGQTHEQFEADIDMAIRLATDFKVSLKSLVFPRNQFNKAYLESCVKSGIDSVRSNPAVWYWNTLVHKDLMAKIFRTGDAYLPLGTKSYSQAVLDKGMPLQQPASRFLRPQSKVSMLNKLRLNRIKQEMIAAAITGKFYHLWWHPHNFGIEPEDALQTLTIILETYQFCKEKYGMETLTMDEVFRKYGLNGKGEI